jgi:hypothetical protein
MEKSTGTTVTTLIWGVGGWGESILRYRCVLRIPFRENVRYYHRRKEMQGFLLLNVCLYNIKDDEANI